MTITSHLGTLTPVDKQPICNTYLITPFFASSSIFLRAFVLVLSVTIPNESFGKNSATCSQCFLLEQKEITQIIIEEVIERTADRLGVLITCSSKKHCEQVAEFLPKDSFGIVTDSTSTKARKKILDDAKKGVIKYVLQIGCLSTGVNVPRWDVIVILRQNTQSYLPNTIKRSGFAHIET